jgi:hypothetical protein
MQGDRDEIMKSPTMDNRNNAAFLGVAFLQKYDPKWSTTWLVNEPETSVAVLTVADVGDPASRA